MTRVRYDNPITVDGIEEHIDFSWEVPYTLRIRHFVSEDIAPLHYAKTIEILICDNLSGTISVNGKIYDFCGQQVFFIAPYVLHSTTIEKCDGTQYILKIDCDKMGDFINFENILKYENQNLNNFNAVCKDYESIIKEVQGLIDDDDNLMSCVGHLGRIFDVLRQNSRKKDILQNVEMQDQNNKLRTIIKWTQTHYSENVSIDDVASIVYLSKYYFCSFFKKTTNMTYWDYLNHVRIYNACGLLRKGMAIEDVCTSVGFQSVPYFSRLFKKILLMTPRQYANLKL